MANTKISAMAAATLPLTGQELVPLVQGGNNVKATVFNLAAASYGEIYVAGGAVPQSFSVVNTFYKIAAFSTNGLANGVTPDAANDRVTISTTGVYLIQFFITFTDSNNKTFSFRCYNETTGAAYANTVVRSHSQSTNPMFIAASAFVQAAAGDNLIVQGACETSSTTVTISDANFALLLLQAL